MILELPFTPLQRYDSGYPLVERKFRLSARLV